MFVLLNLNAEHAINEVDILDFDGTHCRDAVSGSEKMVNDHPIPVFSECTVFARFFEQSGKFLLAVNFLDVSFHRTEDDFTLGDIVIFHHLVGNDAVISEISADSYFADFFNIEKKAA